MTVRELITKLEECDEESEIKVYRRRISILETQDQIFKIFDISEEENEVLLYAELFDSQD